MLFPLITHSHWDREWYHSAVRFRQLLVGMVDELLDDPPTGGASFLLDGQTVVVDDYLDVRPERAGELTSLIRAGALEVGPWFVQADELIPGGEALVRNLLAGARTLRAMGAKAPPVLYCPDTFGHPAALPILALGFGCTSIIASRGYGGARWPDGDSAWWVGPDGRRVLFHHLSRSGYETAASLPHDAAGARERWAQMRADLAPRSRLGIALLMNGADHHARQEHLEQAFEHLRSAAAPDEVRLSSLRAFGEDAAARASATVLPEIRGELRDSYGWMWTLQGTFATRAHQKRRNATLERMLTRDVEPWAALARRDARKPLVDAAWRSLLLCHPHDTICGCSIDEVARAMDARLDEAESQATALCTESLHDMIGHSRTEARVRRDDWKSIVVVRNRAPRARSGVALLRVTSFIADVKVGMHPEDEPASPAKAYTPSISGAAAMQVLSRAVAHERIESPRHYPDDDLVSVSDVAAWIDDVPPYGLVSFRHASRGKRREFPNPVVVGDSVMSNGRVRVKVANDGSVSLTDLASGREIDDVLRWESRTDVGDLYTPAIRDARLAPACKRVRVLHRGPLRGSIETHWALRGVRERITVDVTIVLDADAPFVRFQVSGENGVRDHRLRLGFATGLRNARVFADAAFGPVERVHPDVPPEEMRMELPLRTAPLHRYVTLAASTGATLYSDGLAEYEAMADGCIYVTLVRSVGELSRVDLPERPGNAGWPTLTPGAQCIGPFGGEFALMLHGPRNADSIDLIERTADDVLLPLTGETLRSALRLPAPVHGIELRGNGLAFLAARQDESAGATVLRCVNLLDEPVDGEWVLATPVRAAHYARLDETPVGPASFTGSTIRFRAEAREVITINVRTD